MRLHRHSVGTQPRRKQGHCLTPNRMEGQEEEKDDGRRRRRSRGGGNIYKERGRSTCRRQRLSLQRSNVSFNLPSRMKTAQLEGGDLIKEMRQ